MAGTAAVRLADGRALGYREYGDPAGRPLVSCHGGLVCGLDAAPLDAAARELGIRVIAPDRPGIGASDPRPGRTTADGAADVAGLLDALGLDRAAVMGWSMGGQYALACGALLAGRVARVVVVAGALPLDAPGALEALNPTDRRLTRLAADHPHVATTTFRALGSVARHSPGAWTHLTARDAAPAEAAALAALPGGGLAAASATALADGAGMVEEYRAWARPWGFAPEDVGAPAVVWQGGADRLIPPAWGAELARRIPHARLEARPGAGHFLALTHARAVLASALDA